MRLVLLIFSLVTGLSGQTNPLAGDRAAIDVGKANFRLYCSPCHGIHAQGGRGPDLTRGVFAAGETDADLFRVISQGVQGTEMSEFASRFDEPMIWRFVAFIRSVTQVSPTPVPGDARHGREVFAGAGCSGCHAVGGKGGAIGPALTRIGRERSLEFLREKLLDPNKTITGGYATVTVILRDGQTVRGIEKGWDDFSAQLLDVNRQFHSFRRDEVKSIKREDRSLMPSDYGQKLTQTEQTDLLAFLASLRGEK